MSLQEIIVHLPELNREELRQVDLRLRELLHIEPPSGGATWGAALTEVAGTVPGLPADFAHQHDHYLHGTARK